jgi:hypothetical protein
MVYNSVVGRTGINLLAAVVLAAVPVSAAAQDVAWTTSPGPERILRPVMPPPDERTIDFSGGLVPYRPVLAFEETSQERELRFVSLSKCNLLADIGGRTILDVVAGVPNSMIDWVASGVQPAPGTEELRTLGTSDEGSLLGRMLSGPIESASDRPFDDLLGELLLREQKYFARFHDSDLATFAVNDGAEDIDADGLESAQRKVLFDTARKLYFGRLGNREDRLRDESFHISRWHTVDFVVAPAMIAGFFYVRGWEKKIDVLGLNWNFQVEPVRRILERFEGDHNDLVGAAGVEVGLGDFPIKLLVSMGVEDGEALCDFVGIGTSLGKAKQVVSAALGTDPEE